MRYTTKLLPSQSGSVGIVTLNNLGSLNALTLDMMYSLQDILYEWYSKSSKDDDDSMKAIIFKSATYAADDDNNYTDPNTKKKPRPKAFCAGGDVKQVYLSGLQEFSQSAETSTTTTTTSTTVEPKTLEFFRQEYIVNAMLATYAYGDNNNNTRNTTTTTAATTTTTKPLLLPHISLWDGIVMGGGVGISIWSKYRIATENTIWAMPETAIGLFPDVGSMYWMTRNLPPSIATYLALTGQRLQASDLLSTGIATHYIPSTQLPTLEYDLITAFDDEQQQQQVTQANDIIAPILMSYHLNVPDTKSIVHTNRNRINTIFGDALKATTGTTTTNDTRITMEVILSRLENHIKTASKDDEKLFYQQTYDTIQQMSPTSCRITLEGLYRSYNMNKTIYDNLTMEYRVVTNILQNIQSDFYTGIGSKLIQKNKTKPNWNPASFTDSTDDDIIIRSYFDTPVPNGDEWYFPTELRSLRTTSSSSSSDIPPPTSNL